MPRKTKLLAKTCVVCRSPSQFNRVDCSACHRPVCMDGPCVDMTADEEKIVCWFCKRFP